MEEKKYELLENDTIEVNGKTLYRIKALKDFSCIKKGDLGGYIEKENNLSHDGKCWVYGYGNAKVYDDAEVYGNACVFGDAKVYGGAKVYGYSIIYDSANVYGDAVVYDSANVSGNANVYSYAKVYGNAVVSGDAGVSGNAEVYGNAEIFGNAMVYDNAKVYSYAEVHGDTKISNDAVIGSRFDACTISGFGSAGRTTTFFKCKDNTIRVNCGCFNGTLDEFRSKVKETHGDSKYAKEYLAIADIIEAKMSSK